MISKIFTCYKRNIVAVLVFLLLFTNMGMIDSRAEGNPIDYGETENDTNEGFEFLRDENATVSEPVFVDGPNKESVSGECTNDRIHYINFSGTRGSSDAIIIETNGHYGLIDASYRYGNRFIDSQDPHTSGKEVLRYLSALGVDHLDFVLATHAHNDHIGGIPNIVEAVSGMKMFDSKESSYDIQEEYQDSEGNEIIDQDVKSAMDMASPAVEHATSADAEEEVFLVDETTTYIYKSFTFNQREESLNWGNGICYDEAQEAMEKAVKLVVDEHTGGMDLLGASFNANGSGDLDDTISFQFGDYDITLYNLYPESDFTENANSIMMLVEKDGIKTLLTADINANDQIEQKLAGVIADQKGEMNVLKIPHHGYEKSTSKAFVDILNPKYSVLTTSLNSIEAYSPFYAYMKENGVKLYRTMDISGNGIVQDMTSGLSFFTSEIEEDSVNRLLCKYISTFQITKSFERLFGVPANDIDSEKIIAKKKVTETETVNKVDYIYQTNELIYGGEPIEWNLNYSNHWGRWYNDWDNYDSVYVKKDGSLTKGWSTINNRLYYFDENGIMETGWKKRSDRNVYLIENAAVDRPKGSAAVGWIMVDNEWHYFGTDCLGYFGWVKCNNNWYYFDDGVMFTKGYRKIGNDYYFFDNNGRLGSGFRLIDNIMYYFHKDGKAHLGWITVDGKKYYTDSKGKIFTGWLKDNNNWFYFDASGKMVTGWNEIGAKKYYFDSTGKMQTGWKVINGKTYYLKESGEKVEGWVSKDNNWHFLNSEGEVKSSWITYNGVYYYIDANGIMLTNQWIDNSWLSSSGAANYGFTAEWKMNENGWWYETGDGWYPHDCWQKINEKYFYFSSDGYMACDEWVDGYWLNSSGNIEDKYLANWGCNSEGWYYEDKSGWYPQNQWQKINGKWFFFNSDGYMANNEWIDGYWIDSTGSIDGYSLGLWKKYSSGWRYEDESGWYPKNQWQKIDGERYFFNEKGFYEPDKK